MNVKVFYYEMFVVEINAIDHSQATKHIVTYNCIQLEFN